MPTQNVQNGITVIVQQTFIRKVLLHFDHLSVMGNPMIHRSRVSDLVHHGVQQLLAYSKQRPPAKTVERVDKNSLVRNSEVNAAVLLVYGDTGKEQVLG